MVSEIAKRARLVVRLTSIVVWYLTNSQLVMFINSKLQLIPGEKQCK